MTIVTIPALYVLRHGETDWNANGRLQGQTDIPLNETGRAQARAAASFIATLPLAACYASDLARAYETAQIALQNHPSVQTVIPHTGLRERNFGIMNGCTLEEIERHKQENPDFYIDLDGNGRLFPKDGEPDPLFVGRVRDMFETLTRTHTAPVLIVSHGGVIRQLIRSFIPDCAMFQPGNAHVYRLTPRQDTTWALDQVWPEMTE